MTDDTILSHAEALAEIKRLRARITELETAAMRFSERVFHEAMVMGTLANSTPDDDDQPATYTHDVPPNAPR